MSQMVRYEIRDQKILKIIEEVIDPERDPKAAVEFAKFQMSRERKPSGRKKTVKSEKIS